MAEKKEIFLDKEKNTIKFTTDENREDIFLTPMAIKRGVLEQRLVSGLGDLNLGGNGSDIRIIKFESVAPFPPEL